LLGISPSHRPYDLSGTPPPTSACAPTPAKDAIASGSSLRVGGGQPPSMFRPRGFAPPRRLPSHTPRRFVAPCYRSWGPLRFWVGALPRGRIARLSFPVARITPLEGVPSPPAVPRHRGRCCSGVAVSEFPPLTGIPACRPLPFRRGRPSPLQRCSGRESVTRAGRCQPAASSPSWASSLFKVRPVTAGAECRPASQPYASTPIPRRVSCPRSR